MSAEANISNLPLPDAEFTPAGEPVVEYGEIPLGWRRVAEETAREFAGTDESRSLYGLGQTEILARTLAATENLLEDETAARRLVAFWGILPGIIDDLNLNDQSVGVINKLAGDHPGQSTEYSTESQVNGHYQDRVKGSRKAADISTRTLDDLLGKAKMRVKGWAAIARVVTEEIVTSRPVEVGGIQVVSDQRVLESLFGLSLAELDDYASGLESGSFGSAGSS